jgi:hypothetical protein
VVEDGFLVIGTDNFDSAPARSMGSRFPKWIPHQHISCFSPRTLEYLVSKLPEMVPTERFSYTPWELGLRYLISCVTFGRFGGREFDLNTELDTEDSRPYRFYAIRRILNAGWARLALRQDLRGEMMIFILQKKQLSCSDNLHGNT